MSAPTDPTDRVRLAGARFVQSALDEGLPAYAEPFSVEPYPAAIDRALAILCSHRGDEVAHNFKGRWFKIDVASALAAIPGTELDERLLKHRDEINDLLFAHVRRDLEAAGHGVEQRELRPGRVCPLDEAGGDQAAKAHDGVSRESSAEASPATPPAASERAGWSKEFLAACDEIARQEERAPYGPHPRHRPRGVGRRRPPHPVPRHGPPDPGRGAA